MLEVARYLSHGRDEVILPSSQRLIGHKVSGVEQIGGSADVFWLRCLSLETLLCVRAQMVTQGG